MAHNPTNLQPPFTGIVDTLHDALILLEAAKRGLIPRITRRLFEAEREILIKSGSIFIFDTGETNITRWTDGKTWSASRMKDNYLLYRETKKERKSPDPGHRARKAMPNGEEKTKVEEEVKRWVNSIQSETAYRDDELVKKTITVQVGEFTQHFISYYSLSDALSGRLRQPSTIPELAALDISPEYLVPINKPYRCPPLLWYGPDGIPHYRGEGEYNTGSTSPPSASMPMVAAASTVSSESEADGGDAGSTHSRSFGAHSPGALGFDPRAGGDQFFHPLDYHHLPPLPHHNVDARGYPAPTHSQQHGFLPTPHSQYHHLPPPQGGYYHPQPHGDHFPSTSPTWLHQPPLKQDSYHVEKQHYDVFSVQH